MTLPVTESEPQPESAHPGVVWHQPQGRGITPVSIYKDAPISGAIPDISQFQGFVDWDALEVAYRAGKILAVIVRAGFGVGGVDTQFRRNQAEARRRGIPIIYYWFCYAAYHTPQTEAASCNQTVGPLRAGEAMCGDFEDDPNARPFPRGTSGLEWASQFLDSLQSPTNATWGYSYPFLIATVGLQPLWQKWPFWLADYSATPDSAFNFATLRQFTDCGSTPGVAGCCDQSRILRPPLSQWLTGGPSPIHQEDDMELIVAIDDGSDPVRPGGLFLVTAKLDAVGDYVPCGERNWIDGPASLQPYANLPQVKVNAFALQRCHRGPDIASGSYPAANLETIQAAVLAQSAPVVDVEALATALAPHLQAVDIARLEADLEMALPAATAAAVKTALAKALASSGGG